MEGITGNIQFDSLKGKASQGRLNFSKLDSDLNDYFTTIDNVYGSNMTPTSVDHYEKVRNENEFLANYNRKLIEVYKDLGKLKNMSLTGSVQEAMSMINKKRNTPHYISILKMEPLLLAYEQKNTILEKEVRLSVDGDQQ